VLEFTLFALAAFGHACLLIVAVNFVYALPLNRLFLKAYRAVVGLIVLGGPLLYVIYLGCAITPVLAHFREQPPLALYLLLALGTSCVAFPATTIRRCCRRPPAFVQIETRTIDVAKELGSPPFGDGENIRIARLPGNDIFRVDFTTLTVRLPNLPAAWDGLTLLHLSDLHFFGTPARSYYEFIVQHCLADGVPDLALVTGDIIDDDQFIAWIEPVLGPLSRQAPSFAILGNHDWWQDADGARRQLREIGFQVVSNAWSSIDVRGEKLTLIGHEGPWFRPRPDLSDCPAEGFRLLLSHTPDNIGWARRHGVALMLSGHNHGGQVRLPVVGSIFVPSRFSRRYDEGTFYEPPTLLHVNRGLSGKEPLRFRCRPQVTRIVLRSRA
jgi:uncharacterized protein